MKLNDLIEKTEKDIYIQSSSIKQQGIFQRPELKLVVEPTIEPLNLDEALIIFELFERKISVVDMAKILNRDYRYLHYSILHKLNLSNNSSISISSLLRVESPLRNLYTQFDISFKSEEEMMCDYDKRIENYLRVYAPSIIGMD